MHCPFAHLKSPLALHLFTRILISIQHRNERKRKHSNEFNLTRTVWCPTYKTTQQNTMIVKRLYIFLTKEELQNSPAKTFSLVILLYSVSVCASSSDTSQIIAASELWLILPFDIYVITQLSQYHFLKYKSRRERETIYWFLFIISSNCW